MHIFESRGFAKPTYLADILYVSETQRSSPPFGERLGIEASSGKIEKEWVDISTHDRIFVLAAHGLLLRKPRVAKQPAL